MLSAPKESAKKNHQRLKIRLQSELLVAINYNNNNIYYSKLVTWGLAIYEIGASLYNCRTGLLAIILHKYIYFSLARTI